MSDGSAALVPPQGADYAAALASPPLTNVRRIGGEMFSWTDRDPARAPSAPRGAVLRHLITTMATATTATTGTDAAARAAGTNGAGTDVAAGGAGTDAAGTDATETDAGAMARTVLVAGPLDDELVSALADTGAEVSWLVRSLVDAEHLAAAHPGVTVLAGVVAHLDGAYDLVVALDGVERLNSSEGRQLPAGALLERLAAAVKPGGALLLAHDNRLGLHHTVRLDPAFDAEATDSDWEPSDDHDPERPASRDQLAAALAGAGLAAQVTYAVFPELGAPTVLVGPGLAGAVTSPLRGRLGPILSRAYAEAFRGRPVLTDPRVLLTRALRAGAEDTVAAGWLVIATQPGGPDIDIAHHDLLAGDVRGRHAYAMSESGVTVLHPADKDERFGLRRVTAEDGPAATGYVLEERVLHLCAKRDVKALRAELSAFDDWLREQAADGVLTGPLALAGLSDVLVTADGFAPLPGRWEPVEAVPVDVAATRAYWELAVLLVTSARPHPWPLTEDAVELTATMLGMSGHGIDHADVKAAVLLRVAVDAAELGLDEAEQREREQLLAAIAPGSAPIDVAGYQELTQALWRARYEAAHLQALMDWTEHIITSRDHQLSKLDWEVQFYKKSVGAKTLMMSRSAYKVLRRDGGKIAYRVLGKSGKKKDNPDAVR